MQRNLIAAQWVFAMGFLLIAVSAADAGHWTKWFKPGLQNTGGKRSTEDMNDVEQLFNYRIYRPTVANRNIYDKYDNVLSEEIMKTSKTRLLGLLKALAEDAVAKENGEYSNHLADWTDQN